VSNTLYAFATLGKSPGAQTWAALEQTAAETQVRAMTSQGVAATLWSYGALQQMPGDRMWMALEDAAARVAPGMIPQNVANSVNSKP
jgi:hypothetical protein